MTLPAMPAQGAPWLTYATALDAAVRAAGTSTLSVASTVSASGALVTAKHNPVNATSGVKAMTLPTGAASGTLLSVEKTDASTNAVTVTGNVRGVAATTISLVWQNEALLLAADSAGSWWPVAGHKTKTSLEAFFVPRNGAGVLSTWPTPFTQAHRGGANVYPEDTLPAIRACVSAGIPVGVNAIATIDGALAVLHDLTLDRTTTGTGNVADKTRAQIEALSIDASVWFGQNWGTQRILFLEEVLGEVGRKVPLMIEPMTDASVPAVTAMIQRHGMADTTAIFYGNAAQLAGVYGRTGIKTYLGGTDGTAPVSTFTSNGITGVALLAGQATKAQVDAYRAAGIEVEIHTLTRQSNKTPYAGSDVTQWAADDPVYVSGDVASYRRTQDPFAMQQWYHGMVPSVNNQFVNATVGDYFGWNGPENTGSSNNRGFFLAPNRWGMGNSGHVLQGWGCPIQWLDSSYTIDFDLTHDLVGADTTRYGTIFFACPTDAGYHNQTNRATDNGYLYLMRANGTMELTKVTGGTGSLTTTAATTAITTGTTVHLKVTVTPTAVSVQRDGTTTVTITDAQFRGGYFHFGMATGTANADRRSWSNVKIASA